MIIHKRTRLTPVQRIEIFDGYYKQNKRVCDLSREYHVTRPTIYKIIRRGMLKDFSVHDSTNKRFRCLKYGIRRLAKIEKEIEERITNPVRFEAALRHNIWIRPGRPCLGRFYWTVVNSQ